MFQGQNIEIKETEALFQLSGGDGRKLLNLLELSVEALIDIEKSGTPLVLTNDWVMEVAQTNIALYDKNGEQHYDIVSAFIKSMRGSDPNAAVYWLSRMIAGGEDVKFIARRMLIFSSEDIGNANPNAFLLANACFDAVTKIGYPESRIILSQCAIYLAYGKNYQYSHLGENNFLEQEYLPDNIKNTTLYQPQKNTREQEIKKFLSERWKGKYGY